MGFLGNLFGRKQNDGAGLFVSTAGESAKRVEKVLPRGPSEDARGLLSSAPTTGATVPAPVDGSLDGIQFIVAVKFPSGSKRSRADILAMAAPEIQPYLFVRADGERWRPLRDGSSAVDELRLVLRIFSVTATAQIRPSRESIAKLLPALNRLAVALGARVESVTDIASLGRRQDELATAWQLGQNIAACAVVAPAQAPFEGRAVFDALLSLGFVWGNGDLFSWNDELLVVSTRTPPGYFLPEDAAQGRLRVRDLVFTMPPLGRCPQPPETYEQMVRAAEYVQKRLGGAVLGTDGEPLDVRGDTAQLRSMADKLTALGVAPGSAAARELVTA